jgi:hypothetical protein
VIRLKTIVGLAVLIGLSGCGGPEPRKAPPAAQEAKVQPGTVELRRWQAPAERVVIEPGGVALGAAGEPLTHYLFFSPDRSQDLQAFVRVYAPFQVSTTRGDLAFGGRGKATAGPAEQRMIVEWARLVAAEVAAGRGGASYGLIFAWHRGGAVGSCDDLSVFLTGEVRASSCGWGDEVRGRLAAEPLARLYTWFDGLAPFQEGGEEGSGQIREPSRLVFAGQGTKPATPEEIAAMRAFAPELHRELAARRSGTVAPVASVPPTTEEETAAVTEKLLVPPEAAAGGRPAAAIPETVAVPADPSAPSPTLPRASTAHPPRAGEGATAQETKKEGAEEGQADTEGTPPP